MAGGTAKRKRRPAVPATEQRPQTLRRTLLPPLSIALAALTASALLLLAAATAPLSGGGAVASPSVPALPTSTMGLDAGSTALTQADRILLPPPPAVVDLARLTYAPRASGHRRALPGPFLLVVES